jgi:hypothetical protein
MLFRFKDSESNVDLASPSRRRVLRGAGFAVMLPALPSLMPRRAWGAATTAPKRALWWWVPEGSIPQTPTDENFESTGGTRWFPTGTETDFSFGSDQLTKPLEAVKQDIVLIRGVDTGFVRAAGCPHDVGPRFALSCAGQTSIDQLIGQKMTTRFRTLELGVGTWKLAREDTRIHFLNGAPIEPMNNPNAVFMKLFGDPSQVSTPTGDQTLARLQARRKSVWDAVLDDLKNVRNDASAIDKANLDSYETAIRQAEQALVSTNTMMGQAVGAACKMPGVDLASVSGVKIWDAESSGGQLVLFDKVSAVQQQLAVLALQCDQTRIATLMFMKGRPSQRFDFLDIPRVEALHTYAHENNFNQTGMMESWTECHKWLVGQLVGFIQKLKTTPDIDGRNLIENVVVIKTSDLTTGSHGFRDMPLVLAGRCGGALKTGRYLDFTSNRQRMVNLHLAIAKLMDQPVAQFPVEGGMYANTTPLAI